MSSDESDWRRSARGCNVEERNFQGVWYPCIPLLALLLRRSCLRSLHVLRCSVSHQQKCEKRERPRPRKNSQRVARWICASFGRRYRTEPTLVRDDVREGTNLRNRHLWSDIDVCSQRDEGSFYRWSGPPIGRGNCICTRIRRPTLFK